jgi:hypothetical protein
MVMFWVLVAFFAIWGIAKAAGGSQNDYKWLFANGTPARGILLSVSSMSLGSVGVGLFKFQQRQVQIDIEIPGEEPYEVNVVALVPLNLVADVVPGATVELRVDPKNRNQIAIVGPGVGFNAAMLATQGQINQGAA